LFRVRSQQKQALHFRQLPSIQGAVLAQLRGFGLDFAESEKLFPCESVPALWITPENPL
jgi:hypothetical protein